MIQNKKVNFDYSILLKFNAGIVLNGTEVKSLRLGMGSIQNSYAVISNKEIFLLNMDIPIYRLSQKNHEPLRSRKLLLNKKEIHKLNRSQEKSMTLIPTHVFFNARGLVKVTIALCKGKREFDKRRLIKEREIKKECLNH